MKNSKVLNIFSIIASCVLSIILIFFTVFTPFYFSVTVFTKAETIVKIVQTINYETVIEENDPLSSTLKEFGVDMNNLGETLKARKPLSSYRFMPTMQLKF